MFAILFVCQSVYVCQTVCLSVYVCQPVFLSVCLFASSSVNNYRKLDCFTSNIWKRNLCQDLKCAHYANATNCGTHFATAKTARNKIHSNLIICVSYCFMQFFSVIGFSYGLGAGFARWWLQHSSGLKDWQIKGEDCFIEPFIFFSWALNLIFSFLW